MADSVAAEHIPDSALLFRRIHRHFLNSESGKVSSAAYDGQEMSVNWEKYANAALTAAQDMTGNTMVVTALAADVCRGLGQDVVHDPLPPSSLSEANPAHSLVRGKKTRPVKQQLRDAAAIVWTKSQQA